MTSQDDSAARKEIEALEVEILECVRDRNTARLDQLLGDDFTLTTGRPGTEVRDRGTWLEITRSEYRLESFGFEELEVAVYRDAAVARSRYRQRGSMGGERRNTTFRMTDVWVRHRDGWKLHVRHAQPVEGD